MNTEDDEDYDDVCGETFDHDEVITYDSPDGLQWECRRCGAEVFEERTPASEKGWGQLADKALTALVTIPDLVKVTGLSRRSIRDLIRVAGIQPIPGFGDHGALSYETSAILSAVASMPGKGHRRIPQSTSQNTEAGA